MNRQFRYTNCRLYWLEAKDWTNCGPIGFIEAAQQAATMADLPMVEVEVRDEAEPERIHTFEMVRKVTYECTNPRQGMVDE